MRAGADVAAARAVLQRYPFQAAAKAVLDVRGVPVRPDVRPPLRTLTPAERDALAAEVAGLLAAA